MIYINDYIIDIFVPTLLGQLRTLFALLRRRVLL